ncbi:MAG TPA: hypothetical protein DCM86_02115 [Verrucomicrobiales bacterium]|nr:hypothetical protein [Verrucomicrobiales bacterium]
MFSRWKAESLQEKLGRPYVHILFGARQTGKSTLLRSLIPDPALSIDLADPRERSRYLADPGELINRCRALPANRKGQMVLIDEAQAVPEIFNSVQVLYDSDKERWRFVLCGSSARKLRMTGANLLPGRSMLHRLYPLTLAEHPADTQRSPHAQSPLPLAWRDPRGRRLFPAGDLESRLTFGELPGVVCAPVSDRAELLKTYALNHLEEEIRREAFVRDWGAFVRFLNLAARESGQILNYANIAQETGLSKPTVKAYYQLLEDMFIGFSVPAFSRSPRKNLLSTPRFLFFDLGVRHAAAGLDAVPEIVRAQPGPIFEQWVGIELWNRIQYLGGGGLHHLRTKDGAEIDFIVERKNALTPIEVKWTKRPALSDARHILRFLEEHPKEARHGYIICRIDRPSRLHEQVTALPWSDL